MLNAYSYVKSYDSPLIAYSYGGSCDSPLMTFSCGENHDNCITLPCFVCIVAIITNFTPNFLQCVNGPKQNVGGEQRRIWGEFVAKHNVSLVPSPFPLVPHGAPCVTFCFESGTLSQATYGVRCCCSVAWCMHS